MSLPKSNLVSHDEVLHGLLNSITLVTRALTSVLNAETRQVRLAASKIKQGYMSGAELIFLQKNILSSIQVICTIQIQLQFKLEKILDLTDEAPELSVLMEALRLEEEALTAFMAAEKETKQPLKEQLTAVDASFPKIYDSILHTAEKMQMLIEFMKKV